MERDNFELICDGCCVAFDKVYDEGCILGAENFCADCAAKIRRGKILLSEEQRSDLRRKACAYCGKKLPIGRTGKRCNACALEVLARYFGAAKAERMVRERWQADNQA